MNSGRGGSDDIGREVTTTSGHGYDELGHDMSQIAAGNDLEFGKKMKGASN